MDRKGLVLLGAIALGISGCASARSANAYSASMGRDQMRLEAEPPSGGYPSPSGSSFDSRSVASYDASGTPAPAPGATEAGAGGDAVAPVRVILYEATLGVSVFDVDQTLQKTKALAEEAGGWMQAITTESISVRVPAEKFEALLAKLEDLGGVYQRDVVGQDVSEEFMDLRIRLENAKALRDRLSGLLSQAQKVEDALKIEVELGRVTQDIETLEGKIRFLQSRAAFSTITLHARLRETARPKARRVPFWWMASLGIENLLAY